MKATIFKKIGLAIGVIGGILTLISVSWLATCGIIKLITLCFGLPFSWAKATGIWLALWFLGTIFKK